AEATGFTVLSSATGNGVVNLNPDGTFTYTGNANFNGTDSFNFTVSDGHGGSDSSTATLYVAEVNDPPVANSDSGSLNEDSGSVDANALPNARPGAGPYEAR